MTPTQLEVLLNGLLNNEEKLPYSFYIEEQVRASMYGAARRLSMSAVYGPLPRKGGRQFSENGRCQPSGMGCYVSWTARPTVTVYDSTGISFLGTRLQLDRTGAAGPHEGPVLRPGAACGFGSGSRGMHVLPA